jgi:N-acetylglucosaminyldiphosphoundecaprenol N-acetyl-beta-D-mannosaminyltransferase
MFPVLAEAERQGWRVFYLGSKPGVAERGADIFRGKFPNLQLCTAHGYFRADPESSENRKVLDWINDFQTDILMVGMGMPRQEYWILDNLGHIEANVVISVGACMDYFSGEKPTAPRWMGPLLLEWVYRLFSEPRRLWKRYLLEPWFILGWMLRAWITRTTGRK